MHRDRDSTTSLALEHGEARARPSRLAGEVPEITDWPTRSRGTMKRRMKLTAGGQIVNSEQGGESMARYRTTIESKASANDAFNLICDFSRISEWDPGVVSGKHLDTGPIKVGSRFEVVSAFGPRRIPLTYEVLEWDPPNRAVLQAVTRDFTSYDVISVEDLAGSGSELTYDATLRLHGPRKLFEPALAASFLVIGRRAESGIRQALKRQAAR